MVELSIVAPFVGREEITEFEWESVFYVYFLELFIFSGGL